MYTLRVNVEKIKCFDKTNEEIINFFSNKKEEILTMFNNSSVSINIVEGRNGKVTLFEFEIVSLDDYEKILSVFANEDETSEYYEYRVVTPKNWLAQATNILNGISRYHGALANDGFIDRMREELINSMREEREIKYKEMAFYLVFQIFGDFYRNYGFRLTDTYLRGQIGDVLDFFEYCNIQDEKFFENFYSEQISLKQRISYLMNKRKTYIKRFVKIFKVLAIAEETNSVYNSFCKNETYCDEVGICPCCNQKTNPTFVSLANETKTIVCKEVLCLNGYKNINTIMKEDHFKKGNRSQAIEDNYSLFTSDEVLLSLCVSVKTEEKIDTKKLFDILYNQSSNYGFYQETAFANAAQITTVPLGIKTFGKLCKKLENAGFAIEKITLSQISNFSPEMEAKILELVTNKVLKVSLNKTIVLDLVEMQIRVCDNESEPTETLPFIFSKTQENEQGLCDAIFNSNIIGDENSKILLSIF